MKWKDSDEQASLGVKSNGDFLEDEDPPHWNNSSSSGYLGQVAAQLKRYNPILIGAVLIIFAIGSVKMLFSSGGSDAKRLMVLEKRIQNLEEKYDKFDSIDDKVTRIWEQAKSFEGFKDRFDRTEASMTLRMDHLATNIDSVQKRLASADPHRTSAKSVVASVPQKTHQRSDSKKSEITYHTVAPKETLYGISLKYGIKLENLLEMNRIGKNSVIQPGQKLIVRK